MELKLTRWQEDTEFDNTVKCPRCRCQMSVKEKNEEYDLAECKICNMAWRCLKKRWI